MVSISMLFLRLFSLLQTPTLYGNHYTSDGGIYINLFQNILAKISFNTVAIIFAIIVLAIFVLLAIFRKKGRVLACIAGSFNALGILFTPWMIRIWHTLPIVPVINLLFNSGESNIIPPLLMFTLVMIVKAIIVWVLSSITMIGLVLSIAYSATCFKNKPAIFAVFAIVLCVIKYMFIAPCPAIVPLLIKLILPFYWVVYILVYFVQLFQLILVGLFFVLPPLLLLIPVLINFIKEKKAKKKELNNKLNEEKKETEVKKPEEKSEEKAEEKKSEEKPEVKSEEKAEEKKSEEKPEKKSEDVSEKSE